MRPVPEPVGSFAALLRQLRTSAGLTQEELARAATLSYRSISDLERGINLTARGQTARLLADALNLKGAARATFEAAARGSLPAGGSSLTTAKARLLGASTASGVTAGGVAAATRTLPRDTGAFTGREPELRALIASVTDTSRSGKVVGIHAIGGMAGVGKTTFAIHAAHQLAPRFPDGQVFLSLHAHTPGHRPVDPAEALASLLLTAGIGPGQIPPGLDERVRLWRDHLAGRRLLLLLDDAAGHDQVSPLLPGTAGSLVLVTSRKHLTALDDALTVSLDTLPPTQAAELLARLASRPDLGADDELVGEITRLCGYLPLAIGIVAKQLQHHPAWTAADLAGDLASARDRLELMQAENVSVAAAFDLSYRDLAPDQQRLFRRLGLHPGADIDVHAAAALDDAGLGSTRRRLGVLYDHYLLAEPTRGRYRLHDLVREHARLLAAGDPDPEVQAAVSRLLGYYVHLACEADQQLARRSPAKPPDSLPPPAHAPELATREFAISWMDSERTNLHAVAGYAAEQGRSDAAITLSAATHAYLRFKGHWDQAMVQNAAALELAVRAGDRPAEAAALTNLGDMLLATRDYPAAADTLRQALDLYLDLADQNGEAQVRTELAAALYLAGDNRSAADGLTHALELYRRLGDRLGEALVLSRLASVQLVTGDFAGADASLTQARERYRELGDRLGEAHALNDLGAVQHATGDTGAALLSLKQALVSYEELGDQLGMANALVDLAGVQHLIGEYEAAGTGLSTALDLYRDLGDRLGKANALNVLGAIQQSDGRFSDALDTVREALDLYRDLGDQAGEAEALINIGNLSVESGAVADAIGYFEQAQGIAEAAASLPLAARSLECKGLGQLKLGARAEATATLAEALTIYQRIGGPGAQRIRHALAELDR
jgi:tetratricopeptide (TPR) repeat protein/transcriptional regulator with XRE-family HTH domain